MVKTCGKALLGLCAAAAVLALLIHWITPATILHYREDLLFYLQAHLVLVFSSMAAALLVGVPAGILLSRPGMQAQAERLMQVFNVGNTIPPLAVLAIALAIIGIGNGPAILALFLASLLPIVRNTYEGLRNVSPALKEAATGIGQLDIVWEYTGSSLIVYNHIDEKLDAAASYRRVKQLDEAQGLVWLKPTRFNNTYALAMPEEQAERLGIQSVSDLAWVLAEQQEAEPGSTHLFAMDPEFAGRPDGLGPMSELYGLHFTRNDIRQMDAGLVYTALKNRQVFLGLVYTTDGRLKDFKLRVLKDDKQYFPFYNAAPVVRKEVMQRHPEFATLFDPIIERLDDATMQALNARVDIEQQTPQKVAADFLREHRLLDDGQAGQGGSQ